MKHEDIDHTGLTGIVSITDIVSFPTAETDDTLVLAPDGAGGVEWVAGGGGGGGGLPATVPAYKHILLQSAGYATPIVEAQGSGTLSCTVHFTVSGAVFANIFKNGTRVEQLTASATGDQVFTPFSVVSGDQVYVAWSNGGSAFSDGGSIDLTAGLLPLGIPPGIATV